MTLPSLHEFCIFTAQAVVKSVTGIELPDDDPEVVKVVEDLKQEFIDNYALAGMPNGETEQDLVQYLVENLTFEEES